MSNERIPMVMAGVGSFADVAVLNQPQIRGPALDHYRQVLAPIDPRFYVQFAAPAPLLFQFGFKYRSYPRARFVDFAAAGSEPKTVKWYCADHYLSDPDARWDRLEWLRGAFGLASVRNTVQGCIMTVPEGLA